MRWAVYLFLCAALWWLLTEGRADGWIIGIPTVLLATGVWGGLDQSRSWRWSPMGLIRFACYFLKYSWLGGLDVARRSLHPRLPIAPCLLTYELSLPEGPASVFYMNVVSLLPGTLTADLEGQSLKIHALNEGPTVTEQLAALERVVGGLFALAVPAPSRIRSETS